MSTSCRLIIHEHIQSDLVFKDCDRSQVIEVQAQFTKAAQAVGLTTPDQLNTLGYDQLKQVDWKTVQQAVDHVHCLLPDCEQYMSVGGNPFDIQPKGPLDNPVHIPGFIYFVIFCLAVFFTAQAYDFDLTKLRSLLKRNGKRA
jgi:hypothetical protein